MKFTILISLVLFSTSLFAQPGNLSQSKLSLKLNSYVETKFRISDNFPSPIIFRDNFGTNAFSFSAAKPGIQIETRKGVLHQFELNDLLISFPKNPDYNLSILNFSMRYEFVWPLKLFQNNDRIQSYLGMGALQSFLFYEINPEVNSLYNQKGLAYQGEFYLLSMIQYQINHRFFMEVALPLDFAFYNYQQLNQDNPRIPAEQQSLNSTSLSMNLFEKVALRVGIGFRL